MRGALTPNKTMNTASDLSNVEAREHRPFVISRAFDAPRDFVWKAEKGLAGLNSVTRVLIKV